MMSIMTAQYPTGFQDAVVVGGGAGGLSAAMWLGRYRRSTLVVDAGEQRNALVLDMVVGLDDLRNS